MIAMATMLTLTSQQKSTNSHIARAKGAALNAPIKENNMASCWTCGREIPDDGLYYQEDDGYWFCSAECDEVYCELNKE